MKHKIVLTISMVFVILFLFVFVFGCSGGNGDDDPSPPPASPQGDRVVGYFTSWGIYARNFLITDIHADKLTHINYAFFDIDTENYQLQHHDRWADIQMVFTGQEDRGYPDQTSEQSARGEAGNLGRLRQLKALHPHISTLMSIGGWSLSYKFPPVAATEQTRQIFVSSCIEMMIRHDFDGIDIDWEYPNASNKENFVLLMAEFRRQLDRQGENDGKQYLLSIAAPAGIGNLVNMELDRVSDYVDFINIMTYDFHGGWERVTNHNAPLYSNPNDPAAAAGGNQLNISWTVEYYLNAGVSAGKLNIGIPFYGRAWEEVPEVDHGLFQAGPSLPDTGASGNWEAGMFDYWKIRELITNGSYTRYWDDHSKVPWLYGSNYTPGKTDGGMFVSYEDTESLLGKIRYLREKNLGGIMFWELSSDVRNINDPDSLLRAANEYLNQ